MASKYEIIQEVKSIPKPTCSVCNKQVDDLEYTIDAMTCSIVFIVRCHGDAEHCNMTSRQQYYYKTMKPGYAFSTKRIEE